MCAVSWNLSKGRVFCCDWEVATIVSRVANMFSCVGRKYYRISERYLGLYLVTSFGWKGYCCCYWLGCWLKHSGVFIHHIFAAVILCSNIFKVIVTNRNYVSVKTWDPYNTLKLDCRNIPKPMPHANILVLFPTTSMYLNHPCFRPRPKTFLGHTLTVHQQTSHYASPSSLPHRGPGNLSKELALGQRHCYPDVTRRCSNVARYFALVFADRGGVK